MNDNCLTCAALWREYATATHAHVAIESKLEVARLTHDHPAVQRLLSHAQAAADHRTEMRKQIGEHEGAEHA